MHCGDRPHECAVRLLLWPLSVWSRRASSGGEEEARQYRERRRETRSVLGAVCVWCRLAVPSCSPSRSRLPLAGAEGASWLNWRVELAASERREEVAGKGTPNAESGGRTPRRRNARVQVGAPVGTSMGLAASRGAPSPRRPIGSESSSELETRTIAPTLRAPADAEPGRWCACGAMPRSLTRWQSPFLHSPAANSHAISIAESTSNRRFLRLRACVARWRGMQRS